MKFKPDENFGNRTKKSFERFGHDIETVHDEGLSGAADQVLLRICQSEERCLVTLDLDFSDVTRFPSHESYGIVVLRFPRSPSVLILESMVESFLSVLDVMSPNKALWIVEPERIRVHQRPENS